VWQIKKRIQRRRGRGAENWEQEEVKEKREYRIAAS